MLARRNVYKTTFRVVMLVALLTALSLPAPVLALPFSNGDFETPLQPAGVNTLYNGATIGAWIVVSNSVDHGTEPAGTKCRNNSQCVDLNGEDQGTIAQTFDTVTGCLYTVDFFMSHNAYLSSASLEAFIDGNSVGIFSHTTAVTLGGNGNWEPRGFTFTAAGTSTTLAFRGMISTTPTLGPQIDDVSISANCPGRLKVCKVAGPGVAVGTSFTFTAGSAPSFTVPAGPGPGGTCRVGPTFPQGSTVTVTEAVPAGTQVSDITVAPAPRLVGAPNLAGGSVDVTIGSGVTEVTFTNKRTGFLEICKQIAEGLPASTSTFTFYVNPGNLGPFEVPAGSCSPAIEVAAGTVIIREVPSQLVSCNTIPAVNQGPCNLAAGTSTVNVAPGDVSTQTIAFFNNRP